MIKTVKTVTTTVEVDTPCRPMYWAVISTGVSGSEYVMAQFHTETDARHFVGSVPPQGLEVRKIV
jgi:hypothetical protein